MDFSIFNEFGFINAKAFYNSLVRPNFLNISVPFAAISAAIDFMFGMQPIVLLAFVALLSLELVSGIFAAWIEGQKITSKRMKAFLMMLFVWLVVLFIIHIFAVQYNGNLVNGIFSYLFDAVVLFVCSIYFRSIWENMSRIWGKKEDFKKIIEIFSKKIKTDD
jgi:phage-related holin